MSTPTAITDDYRWLEDASDRRTRAWLEEQRGTTETTLAALAGREHLLGLLRSLVVGPTASPVKHGGVRRFRVGRADQAQPWVLQVADGPDVEWRRILAAPLAPAATVRRWTPSPDGRWLAVQISTGGGEAATPLLVVDVQDGSVVERTGLTRYAPVEWTSDGTGYYYVRRHVDGPGSGVYHHVLGTPVEGDRALLVDHEPVVRHQVCLWHDRWLVVGRRRGTSRTAQVLCVDLLSTEHEPVDLGLVGSSAGAVVVDASGRLVAVSTAGAEFGRLLQSSPRRDGGWGPWSQLIAERPPQVLAGACLIRPEDGSEQLVVLRTVDGCSRLALHDLDTGEEIRTVPLPGDGSVSSLAPSSRPGVLALSYTDWATPLSVWDADVTAGTVTPVDQSADLLVHRPRILVQRSAYRSFDGTDVPITVLRPAGVAAGSPLPTVLTCYGGFGIPFRPSFQPDGLAWVLAGGILAVAAVRGGGERGRQWHRDGAGPHKLTALRDAECGADWLVEQGCTTPHQLALLGGSNGGMVTAGVAVRRPERYAALAVAGAPLDMVRYERWGLGPAWREEYGSAGDPDDLVTLLSYSPFHNVDAGRGRFPATLLSAGTDDTRVDPVHARKMAALLQDTVQGGPVLLRMVAGGGHVGGGDADTLAVDLLAFLATHTGLALVAAT